MYAIKNEQEEQEIVQQDQLNQSSDSIEAEKEDKQDHHHNDESATDLHDDEVGAINKQLIIVKIWDYGLRYPGVCFMQVVIVIRSTY